MRQINVMIERSVEVTKKHKSTRSYWLIKQMNVEERMKT